MNNLRIILILVLLVIVLVAVAYRSLLTFLFILIAGFIIIRLISKESYAICCPNCNFKGVVKKSMRGSSGVELLLWICFILPGMLYSTWRLTTSSVKCPQCGYEYVNSFYHKKNC